MAELFGIQPLVDIISLCLQSGFVKNEKNGVSLIIISKPEGAKTSSIFKFSNLDFVAYYDEITAKKNIGRIHTFGEKQQLQIFVNT